ncbi:uncharacterized [Tachysurus ichikawai]
MVVSRDLGELKWLCDARPHTRAVFGSSSFAFGDDPAPAAPVAFEEWILPVTCCSGKEPSFMILGWRRLHFPSSPLLYILQLHEREQAVSQSSLYMVPDLRAFPI